MDAYPEDWKVDRLGNIGELYKGSGISRAQADSGDLPAIRYGELYTTHSDYVKEYRSRISAEVAKASVLMKRGDIAFAASGETEEEIGKCAVVCDDGVYAGGDLICFRAKAEIDSLFWGFMLNTPVVQRQKTAAAQGATVIHIRRNSIADLIVGYPPIEEQKRIGAALKDIDSLIDNLSKRIEKKKAIKQGAMQELLTGKKRLPGFEGCDDEGVVATQGTECVTTAPTPSEYGGWKKVRLGAVVEVLDNRRIPLSDSERRTGPYPYCGANGIVDFIHDYIYDEPVILIAEDGGNFADYATRPIAYRMSGKFWVNNHAHVLRARPDVDQDFIYYTLAHKDITDLVSGGTRAKLTRGQLDGITIILPSSYAEQRAIAKVLGDMDAEIAKHEAKREKLIGIKKGMMSDLFTGKVRLKGGTE